MSQSAAERNRMIAADFSDNFPRLVRELSRDYDDRISAGLLARGHPGVRSAHSAVLAHLGTGAVRVTDLAERGRVTQQAMGKILRELERMGYVSRAVDATDKRAREIRLTRRGRQLVDDCRAVVAEVQRDLCTRAGEPEMAQLEECLRRVVGRLGLTLQSPADPD